MKLRKKFIKLIIVLIILIPSIYFINSKYQDYLYTKTDEYKLIEKGYKKTDLEYINNSNPKYFLDSEYSKDVLSIVKEKYFLKKNFDKYLTLLNKLYSSSDIVAIINTKNDITHYEKTEETKTTDNELIIVNKYYYLTSSFIPSNLKTISNKYSWGAEGTHKMNKTAYNAFLNMHASAIEDNIYLMINSAYRSYHEQDALYNSIKSNSSEKYADSIAARSGHSEHQTALAIDVFSITDTTQKDFHLSKTYKWLKENSYKFGFILRYPEKKEYITGYSFEGWHYRYVGVSVAKVIHEEDITFDEYYAYYIDK